MLIEKTIQPAESEFVGVYGRRRVGKTFLIREAYGSRIIFELVGACGASSQEQLTLFARSMERMMGTSVSIEVPKNWFVAFKCWKVFWRRGEVKQRRFCFLMNYHG